MTTLRRNRDFVLLQSGQLLSSAGSSFSSVAYPLLVLSLTHSPVKAGAVSFARLLPSPLLGLLAGAAADRWPRRRIMLLADAVRAAALATLALVLAIEPVFWVVPLLAFVEGTGDAFFSACLVGAVRAVVPAAQLPAAVGVQQARAATVGIAAPPLGGALFGLGRVVPFAADAISYSFSFFSLLAMRTPFQEPREHTPGRLRAQLAEGFRFLWHQPFLRTTALLYGVGNFTIPALLFILVVVARSDGLSGGAVGALLAAFSVCLLLGSALAPAARRLMSVRAIMLAEFYAGLATVAFLIRPSIYVLLAAVLPQAIVLPITDSVVIARRIAMTPDRLLGRVEAARVTLARTAQPLGPLVAGLLLGAVSSRATVGVFLAISAALAVAGTASKALRHPPPLAEVDA